MRRGVDTKKKWDDIIKGSLSELGIRPGYYISVNENTGETTIIKENYIVLEKDGNRHLKLLDIIKIYEFKCPGTQESEEYFNNLLFSDNLSKIKQGICPYYPHSMKEFRVLCETWLTDEKTIFINGELEGIRGKDYQEKCLQCETNYPSYYFMKPEELMTYAKTQDPLVIAFFEVLKNHANRIMNNDIKYSELTANDIVQFFIDIVPDVLDFFFIDKPTPYGGFGPSFFIKDKLPDIDNKKTYYIKTENIQDAIEYFNKIKDEYYLDPKLIKY